jgi:hypothetical protein
VAHEPHTAPQNRQCGLQKIILINPFVTSGLQIICCAKDINLNTCAIQSTFVCVSWTADVTCGCSYVQQVWPFLLHNNQWRDVYWKTNSKRMQKDETVPRHLQDATLE